MCSVHLHTGITAEQKRANFSASFNAHCLVVSQEFATLHTHTHTHNVRTYCSVTLFSFLLRAREASATLISKGLFGVPFASLFVPVVSGAERQNHTPVRTQQQPLLQVAHSVMRSIRTWIQNKKQPYRFWSVLSLSTHCCAVSYSKQLILSCAESVRRLGMSNNPVGVGLLVEQGWRVQRAYPVYSRQRESKAVGLGLFPLYQPHSSHWYPESIPSPSYTGMMNRIFPHMFYL